MGRIISVWKEKNMEAMVIRIIPPDKSPVFPLVFGYVMSLIIRNERIIIKTVIITGCIFKAEKSRITKAAPGVGSPVNVSDSNK